MNKSLIEKIALIATGVTITAALIFNPVGCASTPKGPPVPPTQDIHALGQDAANSSKDLKTSTAVIRDNATQGMHDTPPAVQPVLGPRFTNILAAAGTQDQIARNLDVMTQHAATAEAASVKFEADYNTEHAARLKAEDNTTKELKEKFMAFSGILFFASLVLFGVAIWSNGNKILLWGGTLAGIGCAVCIFLVTTLSLIPWIVGGAAVVAVGFLIYSYIHNNGQIKLFSTAAKELSETVEATKPRMTLAGRVAVFGDGATKGDAYVIQSKPTEALVKTWRKDFEKAPSVPATVAIDWNSGSIVDDRNIQPSNKLAETLVQPVQPLMMTVTRKRVLS